MEFKYKKPSIGSIGKRERGNREKREVKGTGEGRKSP